MYQHPTPNPIALVYTHLTPSSVDYEVKFKKYVDLLGWEKRTPLEEIKEIPLVRLKIDRREPSKNGRARRVFKRFLLLWLFLGVLRRTKWRVKDAFLARSLNCATKNPKTDNADLVSGKCSDRRH